jgi:cysteine desulfurase
MVLHHCARAFPTDAEVWVSAIEHPCVLEATRRYFKSRHRLIPVTNGGVVDLEWLRKRLRTRRPGLVAIMAANNETGVLQPWREARALCRECDVPFFCDAAQWIGKLPSAGLGDCDFVSGCAHKFGGPKGAGFLKCPSKGRVHALLLGGKQEEGRRAGTENVAGVISMLAALEARQAALGNGGVMNEPRTRTEPAASSSDGSSEAVQLRVGWRTEFERKLLDVLPGAEVVGSGQERLWNTVSALMPDTGCRQRWVVKLDKLGFAVSTGSACASGREEPSHVLDALGYTPAAASRVLRFSSGWETTPADWRALVNALESIHTTKSRASVLGVR